MRKALLIALSCLTLAVSASALELRAYVGPDTYCDGGWVVVNPAYTGSNPCVIATIPPSPAWLWWVASELWEKPPQVSDADKVRLAGSVQQYNGWTHLNCYAAKQGTAYYYSCFSSGIHFSGGAWQRHETGIPGVTGQHSGSLTTLDNIVRAWWGAQR